MLDFINDFWTLKDAALDKDYKFYKSKVNFNLYKNKSGKYKILSYNKAVLYEIESLPEAKREFVRLAKIQVGEA